MKVLHVLNSLNYSGAEMMILNSKKEFQTFKIENEILITGNNKGKAFLDFRKKNFNIQHICLNEIFLIKSLINIFIAFKIFLFFKKKKYNSVIIHTEANFFLYVLVSKFSGCKKIIRIIHNTFEHKKLIYFRRYIITLISNLLNVIYVSVSSCVKDNEIKLYNNNSILIENYFNNNFKLIEKKKKTQKLNIFCVGNCSNVKNHKIILSALSRLPKFLKWKFYHIGKEERGYPERAIARNLKIFEKCVFLGEKREWNRLVKRNDIFINCSIYEGVGISTLEACSLGMIPILSNVKGNKSIIKKKMDILTFELDETNKLNKLIIKIYKSSQKVKNKYTKTLSEKINKHYNKENL
mgnify:CR=1 FL=1